MNVLKLNAALLNIFYSIDNSRTMNFIIMSPAEHPAHSQELVR